MQWFIGNAAPSNSSVGAVSLSMSTGVHSGACHLFAGGTSHRELLVTGPAATRTIQLEDEAGAGEVLVSSETAALLPADWLGGERDGARLLNLAAAGADVAEAHAAALHAQPDLAEFVPAPLRAALAAGVEPEHRHVVAAFVKFKGVEHVLVEHGVDGHAARVTALAAATGSAVDELGLTWLESDIDVDGGKLYLTGGAPSSTGDDETAMLQALQRIVAADVGLELSAGVNNGLAFAGDVGAATRRTYAVTGDTVNLAARLTARAGAGEVLATAGVLDRATARYETESRPLLVKGKERAVTAYSVGAVLGAKKERTHELPLVGRDAELAVLTEALAAARLRRSGLVELVGEPGIGKSRLLEELRTKALGFQQLTTSGEAYARSTPYGALQPLLRPLAGITPEMTAAEAGELLKPWVEAVMPDLAPWLPLLAIPFNASVPATPESERLDPSVRRERLHDTVRQFLLRVLMMPTLLVIEDAHWLDDASEFLLRDVVSAGAPAPWLVVVTTRPGTATFTTESHGRRIELEPLSADAAAELALAAAGETALSEGQLAAVRERSDGNPLFVRELVAAAKEDGTIDALPHTVETLMTARIDTLDPSDRQLLRYAAVIGPSFELEVLEEVVQDDLADVGDFTRWERLAEFVTRDGPTRLVFNHDLFRTTAYEGLSLRRRAELHGRVGDVLERRAGEAADEVGGLLSLHFLEAAAYEKAWRYAVLAGHRAKRNLANVVAADLFDRAIEAAAHMPQLEPPQVADVYESLGDVCEIFASYERAGAAYAQARLLVRDDEALQARLLWKEGRQRELLGDYNDALSWYGLALPRAEAHPATQVEIELAHASIRHRQGDYEEAARWCLQAIEHAKVADTKPGLAHAYYLLDIAYTRLGRPTEEFRHVALPIYEEIGDLLGQAKVLTNLGTDAYFEGNWDEALTCYKRSLTVAQEAGDVVYAATAKNNIAEIHSDQGRLEDARPGFDEALRTFRASKHFGVPLVVGNLGRLAARAGRFDEAHELLRESLEASRRLGADSWVVDAHARAAECHVFAGEYKEALALDDVLTAASGSGALGAMIERVLGYAHLQARDRDAGSARLRRSLEIAEAIDARYEIALTLKAMADAGLGDVDAQRARANDIFSALDVVSVPEPPLP
jgi:class 3 adenylate cyclase/tetratricopeptide (TPR) repeat protein